MPLELFQVIAIFVFSLLFLLRNFYVDFIKTKKYVKTQGTVVRHEKTGTYSSKGNEMYRAVAVFDVCDKSFEVRSNTMVYPKSLLPKVGKVVNIKFNSENPFDAKWQSSKISSVFSYIVLFGLIAYSVFGIFYLIFANK